MSTNCILIMHQLKNMFCQMKQNHLPLSDLKLSQKPITASIVWLQKVDTWYKWRSNYEYSEPVIFNDNKPFKKCSEYKDILLAALFLIFVDTFQ